MHPADADLLDAVVGAADEGKLAGVQAHLLECARCAEAHRLYSFFLDRAGDSEAAHAAKQASWQLMGRGIAGAERFDHFAPDVAQLLSVPIDEALGVLRSIDGAAWTDGPVSGVRTLPVATGAAVASGGSLAFVARIEDGCSVPLHDHPVDEYALLLQGALESPAGGPTLRRGDLTCFRRGVPHDGRAVFGLPCICLLVWAPT